MWGRHCSRVDCAHAPTDRPRLSQPANRSPRSRYSEKNTRDGHRPLRLLKTRNHNIQDLSNVTKRDKDSKWEDYFIQCMGFVIVFAGQHSVHSQTLPEFSPSSVSSTVFAVARSLLAHAKWPVRSLPTSPSLLSEPGPPDLAPAHSDGETEAEGSGRRTLTLNNSSLSLL